MPRPFFRLLTLMLPMMLMLSVGEAWAWAYEPTATKKSRQGISAADTRAIQLVIRGQMAAIMAGDGRRALTYATPTMRKQFDSAEQFIDMVRDDYPAVWRPASVSFVAIDVIDGEILQSVQISDTEGRVWIAVYEMQQQRDRSWKINGCELVATSTVAI